MKVKLLHRDPEELEGGKVRLRNLDPRLEPFERAREVQRALVSAKLEKIFSKPLVTVLDGHRDSVSCLTRSRHRIGDLFSGSCDGDIKHWDVANRRCVWGVRACDSGFVRGLVTYGSNDQLLLSCGDDRQVQAWKIADHSDITNLDMASVEDTGQMVGLSSDNVEVMGREILAEQTWLCKSVPTSIDSNVQNSKSYSFITTGEMLDIWDINRSSPVHSLEWSVSGSSMLKAKINPSESHLVFGSGTDNAIQLFDLRTNTAIKKLILSAKVNSMDWNPRAPPYIVVASENHNLYTFDIRKLETAVIVHFDFTAPVLDVAFSPTGAEFAAGSLDRSLRIFKNDQRKSRDIYHTKRMQMVLSTCFSSDSRFIYSGSADFCVRVWKTKAWETLGPRHAREKQANAYREVLKERHQYVPEVRRILKHHHVPRTIKKSTEKAKIMLDAMTRKEMNRELHRKPGSIITIPEKKKIISKLSF